MSKGSSRSIIIRKELDRILDDDMGEVNGQNIEDEEIIDDVTAEMDGSVWDVVSAIVYHIGSTGTRINIGSTK